VQRIGEAGKRHPLDGRAQSSWTGKLLQSAVLVRHFSDAQ